VHSFTNPSFGGNPFNSSHLLAIANLDRPDKPRDETAPLTEGELFAQQLRSRLLSALSSSLVQAITGSAPGTSGEFIVGDQTIRFERTLTQITVTILDNVTGETTTITVPVINLAGATPAQTAKGSSTALLGPEASSTPLGASSLELNPLDMNPSLDAAQTSDDYR
jgi:curli production assembly/transport component CsgF